MKKNILALLIFAVFRPAYSIDQGTIDSLNQKGMLVIMGELTGAGSKVSLKSLAGFVLSDGLLLKEKCGSIVVNNSNNNDVASIVRVVFENQNIEASEIEGIIINEKY